MPYSRRIRPHWSDEKAAIAYGVDPSSVDWAHIYRGLAAIDGNDRTRRESARARKALERWAKRP